MNSRPASEADCRQLGPRLRAADLLEVMDDGALSGIDALWTALDLSQEAETLFLDQLPIAMAGWQDFGWFLKSTDSEERVGRRVWLLTAPEVETVKVSFVRWVRQTLASYRFGSRVPLYCEVDPRYRAGVALLERLGFQPVAQREVRSGLDYVLMEQRQWAA